MGIEKEFSLPRLDGMIQRQNMNKIPDTYSPLLVNISLDNPGTWAKRKGSDLLATTQAGNGVQGLINYAKIDDTNTIRVIRSTDLDTYSTTTDTYTQTDAAQFTSGARISSANFNNLVYHTSTDDFLCKESGGSCSDVGSGSDRLKANDVCVAQQTLYASNVTYGNGSARSWQNRVYYSAFDSGNNAPSDQFWNTSEGSLANSTRYFTLPGAVRGSIGFGAGFGLAYHFTAESCYSFSVRIVDNQVGPTEVFKEGLCNKRAKVVCRNYLVFMNDKGNILAWNGSGSPINIGFSIDDDTEGESILSLMSPTQLPYVAAGALGNKVYFSIGDITYFDKTIRNVVVVGLLIEGESGLNVQWSLYSYPVKPVIFANGKFNNQEVLLFGADGTDDVYQMETGLNDNGTAITAYARTKMDVPSSDRRSNNFGDVSITYRPQANNNTYLKVSYAVNGSISMQTISDPDHATNPITSYGVVDMYHPNYATQVDDIKVLNIPPSVQGRSIMFEIENSQLDETFKIHSIGYSCEEIPLNVTANQ